MTRESVGRLVMPAVRWHPAGGFSGERDPARRALDLGAGGFIVFGGTAAGVREFVEEMTAHAGRPLLVGSDLERGAGQQVEGLTGFPPPGALATLGEEAVALAAATTASEARGVGINWIFAPVADLDIEPANPIVQSRSFGDDPGPVSRCVRRWVESCQGAGALACVKHYPGHGRTTTDSHAGVPRVTASARELDADRQPFLAAIDAGVAAVMTAHVAFPALDPSGTPATFSAPILSGLRATGFDGLVVTDALIMEGARRGAEPEAAVDILNAGVDLLLYPHDGPATIAGLLAAMDDGRLPESRVAEAARRYTTALELAHRDAFPLVTAPGSAERIADQLVRGGLVRGPMPRLSPGVELVVVDDDIGGPWPPSPGVVLPRLLEPVTTGAGGGDRVIAVFAEPRGWKERAGLSPSARRRLAELEEGTALVLLFGHPRLVRELPEKVPVLVAWHRQTLLQEAVARWLRAAITGAGAG